MTPHEHFNEAGERYERLYWALRAKKALADHKAADLCEPNIPESAVVTRFDRGRYGTRTIYLPSTLPGERYMTALERAALEAQLAAAPGVTQDDVNRARKARTATKSAAVKARKLVAA